MNESNNAPQGETKGSTKSKQEQAYTESYVLPLGILAMTAVMLVMGWF